MGCTLPHIRTLATDARREHSVSGRRYFVHGRTSAPRRAPSRPLASPPEARHPPRQEVRAGSRAGTEASLSRSRSGALLSSLASSRWCRARSSKSLCPMLRRRARGTRRATAGAAGYDSDDPYNRFVLCQARAVRHLARRRDPLRLPLFAGGAHPTELSHLLEYMYSRMFNIAV